MQVSENASLASSEALLGSLGEREVISEVSHPTTGETPQQSKQLMIIQYKQLSLKQSTTEHKY